LIFVFVFIVPEQFDIVPPKVTGIGSVDWMQGQIERMNPLMDSFVSLSILANAVAMASEHFDGSINMKCSDQIRCPNNIVIMSDEWTTLLAMASMYSLACILLNCTAH